MNPTTLPGVHTVSHDGAVLAYARVGAGRLEEDEIQFVTPTEAPFQVGMMRRPAGTEIRPHRHLQRTYDVRTASEFIYVEAGRVNVGIYTDDWETVETLELSAGEWILFTGGGHSLTVSADAQLIEVKQGPYPGDGLAKVFAPG